MWAAQTVLAEPAPRPPSANVRANTHRRRRPRRPHVTRRIAAAVAGQRDALLDVLEALVYGDPIDVALLRQQLRVPLAAARVAQQLEQERP